MNTYTVTISDVHGHTITEIVVGAVSKFDALTTAVETWDAQSTPFTAFVYEESTPFADFVFTDTITVTITQP